MDFTDVIRPFLIFSKAIGLMPISIKKFKNKVHLRTSLYDRIYSMIVAFAPIVMSVVLYFELIEGLKSKVNDKIAVKKLWDILGRFGPFFPLIQIIYQLVNTKSFIKYVIEIIKFDQNSKAKGMFINHEKHLKIVRCAVFSILTIIVIMLTRHFVMVAKKIYTPNDLIFSLFLQFIFMWFFCVQFFLVGGSVKSRIALLNDYMQDATFTTSESVKSLSKMFGNLCDLIKLMNSTISFPIIFSLANQFAVSILSLYSIIYAISFPQYYRVFFVIISNIIITFIQICLISGVTWVGSSIENEFDRTLSVISDRINNSFDLEINVELSNLSRQLKSRNKKVENLFFVIDFKLMFAVSC